MALRDRLYTVSTGIQAFDSLLGGGVSLGSIIIVDEMNSKKCTPAILRCFLADGLDNGNNLFIASTSTKYPKYLLENLPNKSAKNLSENPGESLGSTQQMK